MSNPTIEALFPKAQESMKAIVEGQPIQLEKGQSLLLGDAELTGGLGTNFVTTEPKKNSTERLEFFIKSETLKNNPSLQVALADRLMHTFAKIPALTDQVLTESWGEHVERLGKNIAAQLSKSSPDLAEFIGKWPGFHKEYGSNIVSDYALNINETGNGFQLFIPIPTKNEKDDGAEKTAETVAGQIRGREEEIKQGLKRALKKYAPEIKDEDLKKFDELALRVNVSSQNKTTTVLIKLLSPEQVKAEEKPESPEAKNLEALKKTNPLSLLPKDKLGKALGRAFLFKGHDFKEPADYFPLVAGRKDMQSALGRLLHKSGTASDVSERILKDDAWKAGNQWNMPPEKREDFKCRPQIYVKPEQPDTMHVEFPVPLGQSEKILRALAEMKGGQKSQDFSPIITEALAAVQAKPEAKEDKIVVPSELVEPVSVCKHCPKQLAV